MCFIILFLYFWYFSSPQVSVVHFSAEWAAQCGQVTDVLKELSKLPELSTANTQFYTCDAEKLSEISMKYKVPI